jgi:hypothetical protein
VVLTVASGPSKMSSTAATASPLAIASTSHRVVVAKSPVAVHGLLHNSGFLVTAGKPVLVAALNRDGGRSNAIVGRAWEANNMRIPHPAPAVPLWNRISEGATKVPSITSADAIRPNLSTGNNWVARNGMRVSPMPGPIGLSTQRTAMPGRILPMHIPVRATAR